MSIEQVPFVKIKLTKDAFNKLHQGQGKQIPAFPEKPQTDTGFEAAVLEYLQFLEESAVFIPVTKLAELLTWLRTFQERSIQHSFVSTTGSIQESKHITEAQARELIRLRAVEANSSYRPAIVNIITPDFSAPAELDEAAAGD